MTQSNVMAAVCKGAQEKYKCFNGLKEKVFLMQADTILYFITCDLSILYACLYQSAVFCSFFNLKSNNSNVTLFFFFNFVITADPKNMQTIFAITQL